MRPARSGWFLQGSSTEIRNILTPVDFSEPSADALSVAASLSGRLGLERCLALHVYFNEATTTFEEYDHLLHENKEDAFARFLALLNRRSVRVVPLVEEGAIVSHVVNQVAEREKVDLLVISTRWRSQSSAILLGSVANRYFWKATCLSLSSSASERA